MMEFALKMLFVASLVGMAVGAWSQYRHKPVDWDMVATGFIVGSFMGPVVLMFIVGIPVGIVWLFA